MCYTVEEIRNRVNNAVAVYNASSDSDARISSVSLFGSYAEGRARDDSDVDLLVTFSSPTVSFFTLARALEAMEQGLGVSVDLVQDPLPEGALLVIGKKVPLYEAA